MALWFGLATGLGEVMLLGLRRYVLHRFLFLGQDVVWMAPVTDTLCFLAVGLLLALAQRQWPEWFTAPVAAGVLAGLSMFALLLMYGPLHRVAAVLIAAGVGYQASRVLAPRFDRFLSIVGRTFPMLVVLLLVAGGTVRGLKLWNEHRAARLRPAPVAGAPNILLIVLDTVRSLSMSLYGYERATTPELERWAPDAVRFTRALSTAPWTLPAHGTMFTGRFPHEMSAGWRTPLDGRFPTLAEALESHGYRSAGFVANTMYCSYETGIQRGFAHYEDYPVTPGRILFSSTLGKLIGVSSFFRYRVVRKRAAEVNREFLSWLDQDREPGPFFAFLNYYDAHGPYQPPVPFDQKFGDASRRKELEQMREDAPARQWPPDVIRAAKDAYDGSIAYMDAELGTLFRELDRRGLTQNTLIIVTSDHGEEFGEHGVFWHGNSLYRPSVQIPLVVRLPGAPPAIRVVDDPVSLRDLAATIMSVALPGVPHPFPGASLSRYWLSERRDSTAAAADTLLQEVNFDPGLPSNTPVSKGPMRAVVWDGGRLIRRG
ncbi:MAG TPA: sulfatase, partial [Gemmatimonadales bacterium]|nr:sulfatase [Gemmatimonadales bacterium]